ncbi:BUD32 family EKC/KEOPS complex subunit [Cochlodiniinecator piscidefendens]|uniref:hypothetical protein n=1 Tax=Cochlodiniinecator piscidefendens TaxID=2715756 RepID=UPI00140D3DE3|nr:hypothetical protein [Cochlodiniinecator piscidefendens]
MSSKYTYIAPGYEAVASFVVHADPLIRIHSTKIKGETFWIKRPEKHGFIQRLQKGDALTQFAKEKEALHDLHEQGIPVSEIIIEGDDILVTKDSGPTLNHFFHDLDGPNTMRAMSDAAMGLADLHKKGISHGRPSLRDICWDDGTLTFLDFENFSPKLNTPAGHARDIIMFVFNALAVTQRPRDEINKAIETYKSCDTQGIWELAQDWCHRHRWIIPVTAPIRAVRSSKEFNAIPPTFEAFKK